LLAPNFALGAVLMMRFAAEAAHYFPDAEIVEMHHQNKLDAPSGTALLTAKRIADARAGTKPTQLPQTTHGLPGARGAVGVGDIPIHSMRLQGFVASQFVTFGGLGQTLTIRHDTLDRSSFMPGVLLALRSLDKIRAAKDVIYGLENLLD
jgi:4-hydroxy-tetrahydrodipicolinate reductase